jgi:hypothetical protein
MDPSTWSAAQVGVGVGLGAASLIASIVVTALVVVRLPSDYFMLEKRPLPFEGRPRWLRIAGRVGLNVAGILLIALGVVLSLPGVPGQGLVTILLGVMLVDIPGKRRLEMAIVRRGMVQRGMNRLRTRFHRPPLQIPAPA